MSVNGKVVAIYFIDKREERNEQINSNKKNTKTLNGKKSDISQFKYNQF